jgi:hypothetical protein
MAVHTVCCQRRLDLAWIRPLELVTLIRYRIARQYNHAGARMAPHLSHVSSSLQNKQYKVFVDYQGRNHEFTFLGKDTVATIKGKVAEAEGIPVETQILSYKDKVRLSSPLLHSTFLTCMSNHFQCTDCDTNSSA